MTQQTAIELANFGNRAEVRELSERLQITLPGGSKYTEREALTLAQIAIAHELDPFNGEVWLIKKEDKVLGALIGIKGHRKHAKKDSNYWGYGGDGGFTRVTDPQKIEEYGATVNDIVFEYRIIDEKNLEAYTGQIERFTAMNVPFEQAVKLIGPPPTTYGVGIWTRGEKTKMKPVQCAMFRAEKDALKRRFDVKFRVEINGDSIQVQTADFEDEPDLEEIEADYQELNGDDPVDTAEIIEELGYSQFDEKDYYSPKVIKAIVLAGYSANKHAAANALSKSNLPKDCEPEAAVTWMKNYRGHRDNEVASDVAAEAANAGEAP